MSIQPTIHLPGQPTAGKGAKADTAGISAKYDAAGSTATIEATVSGPKILPLDAKLSQEEPADEFESLMNERVGITLSTAKMLLDDFTTRDLVRLFKVVFEERSDALQDMVDWAVPLQVFAPSSAITANRYSGTVVSFKDAETEDPEQKRFGSIDSPELKETFGEEVYLDGDQVRKVRVGDEVSFAILLTEDHKPRAFDVVNHSIPEPGQRRQRKVDEGGEPRPKRRRRERKGKGEKGDGKGKGSRQPSDPTQQTYLGTVSFIHQQKGFGFVKSSQIDAIFGPGIDVYFTRNFLGDHDVGNAVKFRIQISEDGTPQVSDVMESALLNFNFSS